MPEQWIFRGEGTGQSRIDRAPPDKQDRVRQRLQHLRQFHDTGGGLWTMMANGGDPYELARLGLQEAVALHIGFGKSSISFLSFSESEETACRYAGMPQDRSTVRGLEGNPADNWDYTACVIFKFRIDLRKPAGIPGVYTLEYTPGHSAFVINGREYLLSMPSASRDTRYWDALQRAKDDAEWLVAPADRIDGETLSALLRKCEHLVAKHYVPADCVPDYGSSATFL
jgi:hypothetical protein